MPEKTLYSSSPLGVAIMGSKSQRHAGLVYKIGKEPPKLLHLAWHYHLRCEDLDKVEGAMLLLECDGIEEEDQIHISKYAEKIWKKNGHKIPYGISYGTTNFFSPEDGSIADKSPAAGLTCATFVMDIFKAQGLLIIDTNNWESRKEDADWQKSILKNLEDYAKKHNFPLESILAQKSCIGSAARFRPEEVVGCAASYSYDESPLVFQDAIKAGQEVIEQMKAENVLIFC